MESDKWVEIADDSDDRKYFTIIPNYVLNHSTLWDQVVYIQMKKIAGESGTCWCSRKVLARQCGMSIRRLDKSITNLLASDWIKNLGTKVVNPDGGEQLVNEYSIQNLWKKNIECYDSEGSAPRAQGYAPRAHPGMHHVHTNKNQSNTIHTIHTNTNTNTAQQSSAKKSTKNSPTFNPLGADIIKAFEEVDPKNKKHYSNKTQRSACDYLVDTYGLEEVLKRISILPRTNKMPYFPKINSPYDLQEKWVKLENAVESKKAEKVTNSTPNYIL